MTEMLRFIAAQDKTFLERFRDWDLDVTDLWDWVVATATYYLDAFGIWGYVIVGLAAIIALLSFDLTHSMTSLVLAGVIRSIGAIFFMTIGVVLGFLFKVTGSSLMARARDSSRFWSARLRQHEPAEDA